ncbi:hypothetical protein Cob_v004719 [Colletotrichum orbiculare MAFF 240422]|uniref:Uncharacterized protein n=1 Tax=Colletotrichum orbiculare (strain 104-T / ATCC 96160 / CBS 514.97 / LARS 414 / MAFF 240422) TaxID=1213857 RepID=N4V882_COLOR|nr:hypothetical protein Cob_v004719 [Colletotrichum orbiculare MAFF 240422]
MVKACLPRLLLLSALICFVLAAAAAAAADTNDGRWARWVEKGEAHQPHRRRGEGRRLAERIPATPSSDPNKPIPLEDRVVIAVPTPAALFSRQDLSNPIDAINQASRSAQQAIAQASQSAREAIQQANDQVRQAQDRQRQAEEQARQANDAATRASISANNAVVQAQASAREGILNAQNVARESASREIAANLQLVTNSASTQLASAIASIQASASASAAQAIAAATQSASAAIQNAQQQAQQQIQAARDDANLRVAQAQGAAVSITQAAIAIVAAIVGSSLLTLLGFFIFTRYRRGKRKDTATAQRLRREISYPKQDTLMTTNGLVGANGFPPDLKRPLSPTRPDTARTVGSAMGYAVSDYGDTPPNFSRSTTFASMTAPQSLQREPSVTRKAVPPSPRKQQMFSLFPPPSREGPSATALPPTPAPKRNRDREADREPPPAGEKLTKVEEVDELEPGSKGYLRRTQTVSPFGDFVESPTDEKGSDWPFARSGSPAPEK